MKKIQLGGHQKISPIKGYALVDDEDFEWLNKIHWCVNYNNYVISTIKGKMVRMGRLIMKTPNGLQTDHINRNKLDNRRVNLRIVTPSQNSMNRGIRKNSVSRCKGVSPARKGKKWQVQIYFNGKYAYLGTFSNKKEAAMAFNEAAKKHHGEFAYLNKI